MLVFTRRPGQAVTLRYPAELNLEPITITVLPDRIISIEAEEQVLILRNELVGPE